MGEGEAAFYRRKGRFSKKFCRNFKEKKQADTAAGYSRTTLYRKLGEMRSAGAGALAALAQGEVEGGHLQSGGVAWEAVLDGTRRQRGRRGAAAPRGEQRVGPGVRGPRAVRAGDRLSLGSESSRARVTKPDVLAAGGAPARELTARTALAGAGAGTGPAALQCFLTSWTGGMVPYFKPEFLPAGLVLPETRSFSATSLVRHQVHHGHADGRGPR